MYSLHDQLFKTPRKEFELFKSSYLTVEALLQKTATASPVKCTSFIPGRKVTCTIILTGKVCHVRIKYPMHIFGIKTFCTAACTIRKRQFLSGCPALYRAMYLYLVNQSEQRKESAYNNSELLLL
jgi:hypothetical protein